jgi:hypothetical protein
MYVSMYVCMYVCMSVCVCVCMCVCMYVCMYVCVCMYIYMYVYVCIFVCMYVCIYVCMCVCICVFMYMCVCMYIQNEKLWRTNSSYVNACWRKWRKYHTTYILRRSLFDVHVTAKWGNILLSSVIRQTTKRVVKCIQDTVQRRTQLWSNDRIIHKRRMLQRALHA